MKEKTKKLLKKLVPVVITTTVVATVLAGCNQDKGQNTKPVDPVDPKPPIEQTQATVSQIMADVREYQEFDLLNKFNDVAVNIVADNIEDNEAIPLSYAIENHNFVVVAENENGSFTSIALPISSACEDYIRNHTTKQDLILGVAGLSGSTMIEESGKATIVTKIKQAISEIEGNVAEIENAAPSQVNNYVAEGDKVDLAELFGDDRSAAYLREDGSVVAFVFDEEKCEITMKHYVVDGAKDMSATQIVAAIKNGASAATSTQLRFDEDLQLPPLETPVVETITVGEIFDQNFADLSFDADIEAAFQKLYNTAYKNSTGTTMFYNLDKEKNQLRIFFNLHALNQDSLIEIYMATPQVMQDLQSGAKLAVISCAGLNTDEQINKDEVALIVGELEFAKGDISNKISEFANLTARQIEAVPYVTNSTEVSSPCDYAKKLFPDKKIVAAYVSDVQMKQSDGAGYFDTGYFDSFKYGFAVKDGAEIKIETGTILVPHYTNSTAESAYAWFLDNEGYKLLNAETTIVSNPTMANEQTAQPSAFNISLPVDVIGDFDKTVQMVDAISQSFAK